jgi:hypothetical protein
MREGWELVSDNVLYVISLKMSVDSLPPAGQGRKHALPEKEFAYGKRIGREVTVGVATAVADWSLTLCGTGHQKAVLCGSRRGCTR